MTEKPQKQRRRGRPPKESKKILVSLRMSPEVLERLKASGAGWQTRLDDALRLITGIKKR